MSKDMGVKALPHAQIFKAGQGKLASLDIPPSKVKHLRHNLQVIMHNPGHLFRTDPNGFVMPYKPSEQELQDAATAQKKAEAAALNSKQGTLFDHLLSNVLGERPSAAAQQQQQPSSSGSNLSQASLVEQMNQLHRQQAQQQQPSAKDAWGVSSNQNGAGVRPQAQCEMTPQSEEHRLVGYCKHWCTWTDCNRTWSSSVHPQGVEHKPRVVCTVCARCEHIVLTALLGTEGGEHTAICLHCRLKQSS